MNKIRLFTVVYEETGHFLVGLKNRTAYFQDGKVLSPSRENEGNIRDIEELREGLTRDEQIEIKRKRLEMYHREKSKEVYDGGNVTFPNEILKKHRWLELFELKEVEGNCKKEYSLNVPKEINFTTNCDDKICFDFPNFNKTETTEKQNLWIVKDVCALKTILKASVNTFKDEFGGYDLFHQIVNNYKDHPFEAKVKSIEVDPNLINYDPAVGYNSEIPVAVYIKLERKDFIRIEHQVQRSLALSAQYAHEIQQGLYTCEEIRDKNNVLPVYNHFNRILNHQNFYHWSLTTFKKSEPCLSDSSVTEYTQFIIKHLKGLELETREASREKKNHEQHLVALKEQIDLLVKSNKTSVKELMEHYGADTVTGFKKNDNDTGTDKANYALYQLINEFNYLVVRMDTGRNSVDHQISSLLEIPKKDGKYQTIKQAACADKAREIEKRDLECIDDDGFCETQLMFCYSNSKIRKNIWPQVNKTYKLLSLEGTEDTLEQDITALSQRVVDQRSWQSFIIDMRGGISASAGTNHAPTPTPIAPIHKPVPKKNEPITKEQPKKFVIKDYN